MFKIGNKIVKSKVVLAPMAGITSSGYRHFMADFGVEIAYTEMVSDMGLIYDNQETKDYINFPKEQNLIGVQLFGSNPKNIAKAAQIVGKNNKNVDFIDINMACPVNKVTKTGAGSSLLKNPKLCGEIIRETKKVTSLPVSAKIRLGWDDENINFYDVIKELENAGVAMIAIHARTRKDLYSGKPRFELLKDLRKTMSVPLLVSGNIYTLDDAINCLNLTGADAVMVARGGIGNPILIKQINAYFENKQMIPNPTLEEQIDYCLTLARYLIEEKGEMKAMRIYRGIATKFLNGYPNTKIIKQRLSTELVTYKNLVDILEEYKSSIY